MSAESVRVLGHLLEVVEDQLQRRQTLELGGQAGKHHVDDVRGTGRELVEELGGDRIEPIECVRNDVEEHERVVVTAVEVDPGHRPLTPRAPLRGERRLAVARRCGDQDDRRIAAAAN